MNWFLNIPPTCSAAARGKQRITTNTQHTDKKAIWGFGNATVRILAVLGCYWSYYIYPVFMQTCAITDIEMMVPHNINAVEQMCSLTCTPASLMWSRLRRTIYVDILHNFHHQVSNADCRSHDYLITIWFMHSGMVIARIKGQHLVTMTVLLWANGGGEWMDTRCCKVNRHFYAQY